MRPWWVLLVVGAVVHLGAIERAEWRGVEVAARSVVVAEAGPFDAAGATVSGDSVKRGEHGVDCPVELEPEEREGSVDRQSRAAPMSSARRLERWTSDASIHPPTRDDSIRRVPRAPPRS